MSLSSTITVYHALHETGELIDNSTSGSSVLSPETLTVSDVEFGVTEYTHSLQATSISSSYFDSSETYTVYPIYAIHHGRVYYDTSNLSSVAFQYDVDNTWIVVYQRDTSVFDAITYTENADVRLWVGSNMMNLETTLIEQDDSIDFFSVDISTGSMSEQYYSYGSAFSPTCNIEMTPTSDITQGKWLRVEFKVFGVWQNFGVFYVKDAPENTSEYVSISGVGALEYLSTIEVEKNYYSAISISQIVDTLATTYGVYVQFNFDVKSDNNYYTKSSIAFPCENEEVEDSDGNSTYNITEGKADYRSVLSRLAIAFCSNVVEHGGVIHIIHNNEYDYLSHTLCNVSEDIMGDEPVQRLDAYYSTESVKTSWKIMKPFEYTSGSYAPIELENSMDYTIMGSSSKYTDADKNLIYYPLKINVENGGFVELAYLTPSIWNVMPYGLYSMKEYCETLGLKEPFYYFPISCSVVGYTPLLHPGSCVSVEFSQGNRNVYIGNVTLSWDGGMFTMDINTPAEIDVSGVDSSSIPSSTTTGASAISIGISNSIANATFLNDKVITASKIADSTITSTQISDSTITGSKIASSTIEDSNIANGTITGTKIANATITGSNLANGTITGTQIANSSITSSNIVDGTITGTDIASATISGSNMVNGTITSTQIAQSTITGSNLADNTITGGKIADTTITGSKLVNGTITGTQIASSTITSSNIVDGTITGTDISSATITNSNIADTTLTGSKFVNGTITATQIADATITGSKISNGTIENTNIKDSTITGAKLVDATITADKIDVEDLVADSGFISELTTNTTFTNYLDANYMEVGFANMDTANIDKANIGILLNEVGLITSATISQGHVTGYLDAVEVNANKITAGTLVADRIAIRGSTSSIVYALNNDGTVTSQEVDTINGSAITERTITADHIVAHSITANELTTANISSPNGYINFSTGYINIGGHLVYDANGFYLDVADELDEKIDQVADGSISFYLTQDVDATNATTTVTANVLRAGVDATEKFSSNYYRWFKKDDNSLEYLSYGYSITVDNEDFDYSGSVICKFLPVVSGNPITISDASNTNCETLVATLSPTQASGTPTPSNPLEISGVSTLNVNRTGKNIAPFVDNAVASVSNLTVTTTSDGGIHISGKPRVEWAGLTSAISMYIPSGTTITLSRSVATNYRMYIHFTYTDNTTEDLQVLDRKTYATKTLSKDVSTIKLYLSVLSTSKNYNETIYPQLEIGSSATPYEPYQGTSITLNLGSTIYGGSVDLRSGVLTVDRKMYEFDGSSDEAWSVGGSNSSGLYNFYIAHSGDISANQGICNLLPLQTSLFSETTEEGFFINANHIFLRLSSSRATTVAELRTWLASNNVQICGVLTTPTTTQLTPQTLRLLQGNNTLWTNGESLEVQYQPNNYDWISDQLS